ncbi:adenylyl-sulfate kinase [Pontibacter sp. H249]|uniref:adenylyl-sulfate kinase n=1 Tax=Pontibacter sp. H249 TaxID=3133420 RepID=UPI0030C0667F
MKNIYPFQPKVSYAQRKQQMQQEPSLVWFTGLSGSGKSTLALRLEHYLFIRGYKVYLLDGDNMRSGLNSDLSFTDTDRKENIRRVGEVAKLMLDAGLVVICAFISPFEEKRTLVKSMVGKDRFTEVFVNCSLHVCEARDTKGLYLKARAGLQPNFEVKTDQESIDESVHKLINYIEPLLQAKPQTTVAV